MTEAKAVLQPMITELIERSQAAGKLRPDITATDVMVGVMMLGTVIDATRDIRPDAWQRYMALALDGLAPATATAHGSPASRSPLTSSTRRSTACTPDAGAETAPPGLVKRQ